MTTRVALVVDLSDHPVPESWLEQIRTLLDADRLVHVKAGGHYELDETLGRQVARRIAELDIPPETWRAGAVALLCPGMSTAACAAAALLHGIVGGFPRLVVTTRTPAGEYEVSGLLDLQALRGEARMLLRPRELKRFE